MITIAQETLVLRRSSFSLDLSLLIAAYSLPCAPAALTVDLLSTGNALLPRKPKARILSFGRRLSPVTFSAQGRSTSELLRTL